MPNDPTNLGRSLLLLQKVGLIKLKDGVGLLPTVLDVVENPKNLKIVELEAPQRLALWTTRKSLWQLSIPPMPARLA